jgi:hypothetical protein
MSFDLTNEEKVSLINQRLKSFQAEKFQHELNKATAEAVNNEDAVQASQEAIDTLNVAIQTHLDVLNSLSE